jgi:hypothetical protein
MRLSHLRCMSLGPVSAGLVAGLAVAFAMPARAAAPSQLFGKSVVVSWIEDREQRGASDSHTRHVARNGQFSVYVASTGRPFSRMSYAFATGRGLRSGGKDAVGGESARNVSFSGTSMSVTMPMQGGARNIAVTFQPGFTGCSAKVLTGKESSGGSIKTRSLIGGGDVEFISVKTSGESCRVQDGNVFGN